MTPDELRTAMRAYGRVPDASIDIAVRALVDGGAASVIVEAKPIESMTYLGFADATGRRVAWLHAGFVDVHQDYEPPYAITPEPWPTSRRVTFPGYMESTGAVRKAERPLPCQICFNAPEFCECPAERGSSSGRCRR